MRRFRVLRWLRSSLWFIPLVSVVVAVLLSIALLEVDRRNPGLVSPSITGTSTALKTILSTVAASMVTLTTLVLTITTVAVQLSMGQFSPRIVRALLEDRPSQFAYGLFAATFTFALLALRGLDQPPGFVPAITVLTAYALTLASIGTLFLYMHHSGQRLSAAGLIKFVGDHLTVEIERYPLTEAGPASSPADAQQLVMADRGGVVDRIDIDALVAGASAHDGRIAILPRLGDFVPTGAPLARVHSDRGRGRSDVSRQVRRHIVLAPSRTHTDDPAYGIRKLVDVAERSLASGPFTDPTTAVQAIDRLHDALRQLALRRLPPTEHRDEDGVVRLVTSELDWAGFVRLAFDEVRIAGIASPQVVRRLHAALDDLLSVAPADRREPLRRQIVLLRSGVKDAFDEDDDKLAMAYPDAQGIGSGADLLQKGHVAKKD